MNILISNLTGNVISSDLVKLFSYYGNVSYAAVIRDRKTGRSKGNAFLEMPNEFQGEQAVIALNHSQLDGQEILVQEIQYKAGEFNN